MKTDEKEQRYKRMAKTVRFNFPGRTDTDIELTITKGDWGVEGIHVHQQGDDYREAFLSPPYAMKVAWKIFEEACALNGFSPEDVVPVTARERTDHPDGWAPDWLRDVEVDWQYSCHCCADADIYPNPDHVFEISTDPEDAPEDCKCDDK